MSAAIDENTRQEVVLVKNEADVKALNARLAEGWRLVSALTTLPSGDIQFYGLQPVGVSHQSPLVLLEITVDKYQVYLQRQADKAVEEQQQKAAALAKQQAEHEQRKQAEIKQQADAWATVANIPVSEYFTQLTGMQLQRLQILTVGDLQRTTGTELRENAVPAASLYSISARLAKVGIRWQ